MTRGLTIEPCTLAHVGVMQRSGEGHMTVGQLSYAFTACSEGVPLCCWGITPLWAGVGIAWFIERQPWTGHPYASRIARAVKRSWAQRPQGYRYIEALVALERPDSQRLIEWLGFRCVAVKKGYSPDGATMLEYAWRADDGA